MIEFELPLAYELLGDHPERNRIADLALQIDGSTVSRAQRATNGNCLLEWDTLYSGPGTHHVQAKLTIGRRSGGHHFVSVGPVLTVSLTNILKFDPFNLLFSGSQGVFLSARSAESNIHYRIDLLSPEGSLLNQVKGVAQNGEIHERWMLLDYQGNPYGGNIVVAIFNVTSPGRAPIVQTQVFTRYHE